MTTRGAQNAGELRFKTAYQKLCWVLAFVTGGLTILLLFVWFISIDFSIQEHAKLLQGPPPAFVAADAQSRTNAVAVGGLPAGASGLHSSVAARPAYKALIEPSLPEPFRRCFFLIYGIDLSTVTAGLAWYFMFCLFKGVCQVAKGEVAAAVSRTFPFPRNYVNTWVQLGLIGTIWGFLLLGFGLQGRTGLHESEAIINLLIQAFGTALLSTFAGVVLAYVAAPLVQAWFSRCLVVPVDPRGEEMASAEFIVLVQKVNDSFRELAKATEANRGEFGKTFQALTTEVTALKQRVEDFFSKPAKPLSDLNNSLSEVKSCLVTLAGGVNGLKTPLANLEAVAKYNGTQEKTALETLGKTVADSCKTSAETLKQAEEQTRKDVVAEIQKLAGTPADGNGKRLDTLNGQLQTLCSELSKVHRELARLPNLLADQHEQLARQLEVMTSRDRTAVRGLTVAGPALRKSRLFGWLSLFRRDGQ